MSKPSSDTMQLAHRIADAACTMDWLQASLKQINDPKLAELIAKAEQHVDFLHDMAETLAGQNATEIYASDNEISQIDIVQAAGMTA